VIEISQQKLLGGGKSANSFPGNNEFQSVEVKKKAGNPGGRRG